MVDEVDELDAFFFGKFTAPPVFSVSSGGLADQHDDQTDLIVFIKYQHRVVHEASFTAQFTRRNVFCYVILREFSGDAFQNSFAAGLAVIDFFVGVLRY